MAKTTINQQLPKIKWKLPKYKHSVQQQTEALKSFLAKTISPSAFNVTGFEISDAVNQALSETGTPVTAGSENNPKQDVIGLLKLAAEVEHALMVQYLYAAGSAKADVRDAILKVAVEEMGHLMTVQNLLFSITGINLQGIPSDLYFGRDAIRVQNSDYNPLPLIFEQVSETALKKYVLVEQPGVISDPPTNSRAL